MLHSSNSRHRTWLLAGLTGAILLGGGFAMAGTAAANEPQTPPAAGIPNTNLTEAVDAALDERPECEATAALLDDSAETVWSIILECDDGAMHYVEVDAVTGDIKDDGAPSDAKQGTGQNDKGNDTSTSGGNGQTGDNKSSDKDDKDDKGNDPNDASGTGANVDKSSGDTKDNKTDKEPANDVAPARN